MNEKELFNKAYNLVKNKKTWMQKWFAKDSNGNDCRGMSPDAVCWCSIGALEKFMPDTYSNPVYANVLAAFAKHLPINRTLSAFNDRMPHDTVVALWLQVGKTEGWL